MNQCSIKELSEDFHIKYSNYRFLSTTSVPYASGSFYTYRVKSQSRKTFNFFDDFSYTDWNGFCYNNFYHSIYGLDRKGVSIF